MRYFISAGEASGDIHAASLMAELRRQDPGAQFVFLGGDLMAAEAGHAPLIHYRDMAFMGFCEVIRHLRKVLSNLSTARRALLDEQPDALILVDYPSFNLRLAKTAYEAGIPVFYYISPKVWAWKERRVRKIKRYVRRMLSILPFERQFYLSRHNYEITYVGNPTLEEIDRRVGPMLRDEGFRARFCAAHSLDPALPILALVPGSRRGEIRNNLPVMDAVAARHPRMQAVIAGAPGIDREIYRRYSSLPVVDDTFGLEVAAEAALVTSGTATLEAALIGVPQVVCYRANGSRLSYGLFKRILKIPFVSLPNLIADREVVKEMLLHHCNPAEVDASLTEILPGAPGRDTMLQGYADIRNILTDANAPSTAARLILSDLQQKLR